MKTGSARQSRPVLGNSVGVKTTENNTFCAPVWRLSDLHSGQIIAQSVSDQRSCINRSYSSSSWEGAGGGILAQAVYQRLRVQIRLKHNRAAADVVAMHLQIHYHPPPPTRRQRFQSCAYITWKFSSLTCLPRKRRRQEGSGCSTRMFEKEPAASERCVRCRWWIC